MLIRLLCIDGNEYESAFGYADAELQALLQSRGIDDELMRREVLKKVGCGFFRLNASQKINYLGHMKRPMQRNPYLRLSNIGIVKHKI